MDLGFLVDGSANVAKTDFGQLLEIVKFIYSAFPVSPKGVHVGLGVISSNPEIVFGFDKYRNKPSLDSAISGVQYPSNQPDANIGKAITAAKDMLYGKSSRRRVRQVPYNSIWGKECYG